MPDMKQILEDWDWEEFAGITFSIVLGTIFIVIILSLVGSLIWLLWTSGLAWLVVAFGVLVVVALIIAGIVQVVQLRNRGW